MSVRTDGSRRVVGIDVARALAALIMLQGHATDAWVAPEHQDAAFRASRFLGTFPLPAFLLLAGTSVAWRVAVGEERGEGAAKIARSLRMRGATLLATGYAVSFLFALMDGALSNARLFTETVLRADVLHVIGLSIALAGVLLPNERGFGTKLLWRCLALGVALTAICPLLPAFEVPLVLAAPLGLFVDAAPITRMPLVPLFAWFAAGMLCAHFMRGAKSTRFAESAGTSPGRLAFLGALALAAVFAGGSLMDALHEFYGGPLSRRHVAIVGNVVDLAGRGALVLVAGAALAPFLPRRLERHLVLLGRGSLVAYVVHLPFCYGRLGAPLRDSLSSAEAAAATLVLALGAYTFVRLWPGLRASAERRGKRARRFFAR